jgi:ubiquinone/menaquinone biosynthesis C-methylase UbiE
VKQVENQNNSNSSSDLNYQRIYKYRFRQSPAQHRRDIWKVISCWIYLQFQKPEKVLDPAAGQMEFISSVPSKERWAVDKYQAAPAVLPENLKYLQDDIFEANLPDNYFDLIFVSNFLEHLSSPEEIHQFFVKAKQLLRVGGRVLVIGPNFKHCADRYFDCADHRMILTDLGVEELLYSAGFECEKTWSKFLPYSFRSRLPQNAFLVKLYLSIPLFWRFFGKQFLVVGQKSG